VYSSTEWGKGREEQETNPCGKQERPDKSHLFQLERCGIASEVTCFLGRGNDLFRPELTEGGGGGGTMEQKGARRLKAYS